MEPAQSHDVVCFGEVLWDILPAGALPGGAPMNVAYHLKKLGANPGLITKIGTDDYGKKLVNILAKHLVATDYFQVDYSHPTGLVYANMNNHQEVIYDIVYPSAWDFIEWDEDFTGIVGKAEYFIYGSLTSRNKNSRDTLYELLDLATKKVLDINLRSPYYSRPNLEYLLQKANILKLNEAELDLITGWFSPFANIEDRVKLLQEHFALEAVILTMGGNGSLVHSGGRFYRHGGFSVQVADTIGSGDSFLAGYISCLLNGNSIENALLFASGIGGFIASKHGACPEYEIDEIHAFIASRSNQHFSTIKNFQ